MLRKLIKRLSLRAMRKELDEYIDFVEVSTDKELGNILALGLVARVFLERTSEVSRPFPDAEFRGFVPIDREVTVKLAIYNFELIGFRKRLHRYHENDPGIVEIQCGFALLVMTLRAIGNMDLYTRGRRVWHELKRGSPYWRASLREMGSNLKPDEIERFWLVPNTLVPEAWLEL